MGNIEIRSKKESLIMDESSQTKKQKLNVETGKMSAVAMSKPVSEAATIG